MRPAAPVRAVDSPSPASGGGGALCSIPARLANARAGLCRQPSLQALDFIRKTCPCLTCADVREVVARIASTTVNPGA